MAVPQPAYEPGIRLFFQIGTRLQKSSMRSFKICSYALFDIYFTETIKDVLLRMAYCPIDYMF